MLEMPHSALEALTDDLLIHKIPMSTYCVPNRLFLEDTVTLLELTVQLERLPFNLNTC